MANLDPNKQVNVKREVEQALSKIFGRHAEIRVNDELAQLKALLKAVQTLDHALQGLNEPARGTLEEMSEDHRKGGSAAELLDRVAALRPGLEEHVEGTEDYARELGDTAGGPDHDPRTERLATALADIYSQHFDDPPTYTVDPERGYAISPFARFVDDVFAHYLADLPIPKTAIREATRKAAAALDWSDVVESNE